MLTDAYLATQNERASLDLQSNKIHWASCHRALFFHTSFYLFTRSIMQTGGHFPHTISRIPNAQQCTNTTV